MTIIRSTNHSRSKTFVNNGELGFYQFTAIWNLECHYEPHVFREEHLETVTVGDHVGYAPDFWLPQLDAYVEIHDGLKPDRRRRQLTPKQRRIRWLGRHTGIPVILIHYSNWPDSLSDLMRLERRASLAATFEYAMPTNLTACP